MVHVSKKASAVSTITESGRVLGPITRGRLLRAGVRVPYYIKGDVSKFKIIILIINLMSEKFMGLFFSFVCFQLKSSLHFRTLELKQSPQEMLKLKY